MSQSPIDVPAAVQMGSASASKPLAFADYQNVRCNMLSIILMYLIYISLGEN